MMFRSFDFSKFTFLAASILFVAMGASSAHALTQEDFLGEYVTEKTVSGSCPDKPVEFKKHKFNGTCNEWDLEAWGNGLFQQIIGVNCGKTNTPLVDEGLYMGTGVKVYVGFTGGEARIDGNVLRDHYEKVINRAPNPFFPLFKIPVTVEERLFEAKLENGMLTYKDSQMVENDAKRTYTNECVLKKTR